MDYTAENLTTKTVSGATWSAVARIGQQGVSLLATAILARLLQPSAYGLLGMATVVIGFIEIFKDLGTSLALIQRRELTNEVISSVFWVNVLFGFLAASVTAGIAPLAAIFYGEPQVTPVMAVLSISFVVSSLSIVQQALLTREMAFNKLARIELTSSVMGAIVGIAMAFSGAGVWSLVALSLTGTITGTVLLWIVSRWRPRLYLGWNEIRSIGSFGINLTGFNVVNYFARNADNLLIGRYLGATALGYYALAYRLMLYPLQNISGVLGRVLFPAFASIQDDNARFRRAYLRACAIIAAVTFPLMLGMLITAEPLVAAILGSRWMPVAPLLMILALVGMVQSIATTVGHIYMAKGRTDWMFRWGMAASTLAVASFVVGLSWGIVGVAAAYGIVSLLLAYPNFAIPFRLIDLSVKDLVVSLWPVLRSSLIMLSCVAILRIALNWLGITQPWAMLGIMVTVGIIAYVVALVVSRSPALLDVLELLPLRQVSWLQWIVAVMGLDTCHGNRL